MKKVAPLPGSESQLTDPDIDSTSRLTIDRPNPDPLPWRIPEDCNWVN